MQNAARVSRLKAIRDLGCPILTASSTSIAPEWTFCATVSPSMYAMAMYQTPSASPISYTVHTDG